jgi:putative phosphoesterase
MRVAALFDIHGNLPALEATLRDVRAAGVDRIVVGGDVVPGPMLRETLDVLAGQGLPVDAILGNGEAAVLAVSQGMDPGPMPEVAREAIRWSARELRPEDLAAMATWPKTLRLRIPEVGEVFFCHGTPRHENEIFTKATPAERLMPLFESLGAAVAVCGHTHMAFARRIGDVRVLNAGSVGMPFGRPGADWILIGPGLELRHTDYDLRVAAARIRATSYPQAEEFAAHSVIEPPSEAQMLEVLGRAELRYAPPKDS